MGTEIEPKCSEDLFLVFTSIWGQNSELEQSQFVAKPFFFWSSPQFGSNSPKFRIKIALLKLNQTSKKMPPPRNLLNQQKIDACGYAKDTVYDQIKEEQIQSTSISLNHWMCFQKIMKLKIF